MATNQDGIISVGTIQNVVRAFTIPDDTVKGITAGVSQAGNALARPIQEYVSLLDKHIGEVEGQPGASAEAVQKMLLELTGTAKPSVDAIQNLNVEIMRTYRDAARAFADALDGVVKELESKPGALHDEVVSTVSKAADGFSPTLGAVQNVYTQTIRSYKDLIKLISTAVSSVGSSLNQNSNDPAASSPEKISVS